MNYAKTIQELRIHFGETNSGLERVLGLSNGYLSKFAKNKIDNPSKLQIALASKGINVEWFLTGKGPMIKPSDIVPDNRPNFRLNDENFFHEKAENSASLNRLTSKPNDEKNFDQEVDKSTPPPLPDTVADSRMNPSTGRGTPPGVPLVIEGDSELAEGIVIPLLENAASAGYGADLEEDDIPARYVRVPKFLARYPHLASLPVKGDSMEPTLHDGDLVVCDGGGWDGDGLYVLKTFDAAYVKRVQLSSEGYRVISDNKMYQTVIERAEGISIVGKVRAILVLVPGRRGGI